MKTFCKDYLELCKSSVDFMKKHWLGCIIFTIVYTLICCAAVLVNWSEVFNKVKKFFKKDEVTAEES